MCQIFSKRTTYINLYCATTRTRFAQARAELGLTNRMGGPQSPNYIHWTRPELCEEEDAPKRRSQLP